MKIEIFVHKEIDQLKYQVNKFIESVKVMDLYYSTFENEHRLVLLYEKGVEPE